LARLGYVKAKVNVSLCLSTVTRIRMGKWKKAPQILNIKHKIDLVGQFHATAALLRIHWIVR